jgi:ABC-type phosphate/phosphonate transport system substrate-binding protein
MIFSLFIGLALAMALLRVVTTQNREIELQRAALEEESVQQITTTWSQPDKEEVLISSKYLAILDRRSPELKTPTIELTIGARNDGEPLSLAQSYARLLGHLERDLTSRLGEPVAFNLKLIKIGVDSPRLLAQRRADFILMDSLEYLMAKELAPGITPIAREKKQPTGVIFAHKDAGIHSLQHLRGKCIAFPDPHQAKTILAKATLASAGLSVSLLKCHTNFADRTEIIEGKSNVAAQVKRHIGNRHTIFVVAGANRHAIVTAPVAERFEAGITSRRRYEMDKHLGLNAIHYFDDVPGVIVGREELPTSVIEAVRNALASLGHESALFKGMPLQERFDWDEGFMGVVPINDDFFNGLRSAVKLAEQFEGQPIIPIAGSVDRN